MFDPARLLLHTATIAGLALLAACTSTQSEVETADEMLPQPQVVVVDTFAVSPDEVKLDDGLSADVEQLLKEQKGLSRSQQEVEAGRKVADALTDKLVVEIRDLGLQAERGSAVPAGVENAALIRGQLISIDAGNRTERVVIGLGAGRSDVRAEVQVYEVTPTGQRLIDTVEVDGKSGLTPGMAETMGAGGLAGHILVSTVVSSGMHVASETMGTDVVADADRAAKGIAKQLATVFAQQGWTH